MSEIADSVDAMTDEIAAASEEQSTTSEEIARSVQSISTAAGPLTTLILRLIYPALIIGLVLSIGVSARRSGGIT